MRWLLGVLVGGFVDVVSTGVLGGIAFMLFLQSHIGSQTPIAPEDLRQAMQNGSIAYWTNWTIGAAGSILGGYLSALIARRSPLLSGALSAWLGMGIGVLSLLSGKISLSLWDDLAGLVLSPFLGLAGGYLRRLRLNRHADQERKVALGAFD